MNAIHDTAPLTQRDKIFLAIVFLLLVGFAALQCVKAGSGDKGWLLLAARNWLQGKKLYVDIFEVNPPLIVWLYAVPVYISMHCVLLQDYQVLALLGMLAVLLIIDLSLQLIRLHPEFRTGKKQGEFCLLLASIFIIFQDPEYFFDREYIFLLLMLPYILRWLPSLSKIRAPSYVSLLTGIAAGIGFCIKPHCLLVFFGLNLVYLLRERNFAIITSAENMSVYLIAGLYVTSVWLVTPEYAGVVLPMALASYSATNMRNARYLFLAIAFLYFGMTFADFRLRYTSPYRKDIFYLLFVALLLVLYALINNGWGYTWNPLFSLGLVITGFVLREHTYLKKEHEAKGLATKPFVFGIRACKAVFACQLVYTFLYAFATLNSCVNFYVCDDAQEFIHSIETANHEQSISSFGTLAMDFHLWSHLASNEGADIRTRFNHLWMLPKFFISDDAFAKKNRWIIDYVGNAYADDLTKNKPQLVFVADTINFYSVQQNIDLLAFLLENSPAFAAAWKSYNYAGRVDDPGNGKSRTIHHGYFIYKRTDE